MLQYPIVKSQLNDVLKLYQSKTREFVIQTGSFRRDVLTDTVFALKDIAEKLVKMVDTLQSDVRIENKVETLLHEALPRILQQTLLQQKDQAVDIDQPVNQRNLEKHAVINEPENGNFNKDTWAETLKRVDQKLVNVPVKKNLVNRDGKGYILLPDLESQQRAEVALRNDFVVTASTRQNTKLLPKMKIHDLTGYDRNDKDGLKQAILQKNPQIKQLVDDGKTLDIIFIDTVKSCAVIKVSSEIRKCIMKFSSLYIGMRSHHVKDQFHLTQCYKCQKYGHKQGSEHCTLPRCEQCMFVL